VRGLTTAGSSWITAAIGILFGIGFYFPAILNTALVLGVLAMFRWIEDRMPSRLYARHHIRFDPDEFMRESVLRATLAEHGFTIANMSYRVVDNGQFCEYRMVMRTTDQRNTARLARDLCELANVREFRISPTGD